MQKDFSSKITPLKGLITALITPFKQDLTLDTDGFIKNVTVQQQANVDALLVLGTTGETPTLSLQEKTTLLTLANKHAPTVPLVVGTGTNHTASTINTTKWAADHGASFALVASPYYNKPPQRGLISHFLQVAEASPIPLVLYNIPSRTGVSLDLHTVVSLAKHPNILGIKESSGSLPFWQELSYAMHQDPSSFSLFAGDDAWTLTTMVQGGVGLFSVLANLFPKKMKALVEAASKQEIQKALKLQQELYPFFKATFMDTNPIPIKAAMHLTNLPAGEVRPPLAPLQDADINHLQHLLATCQK